MSEMNQKWKDAVAQAKASEALRKIVQDHGVPLVQKNVAGKEMWVADKCPWCGKKERFNINRKDGETWLYGCYNQICEAHHGGDAIKFLINTRGVDYKEARRMLLEIAGIPIPEYEHSDRKQERSATPEPNPDSGAGDDSGIDAPEFIRIPDIGRNPYESAWVMMSLTASHRNDLRTKRGLPDTWNDALGFRSSLRTNRKTLEPLLEMFPVNDLLRTGIAVRQKADWKKLKISDQLCGGYWERDEESGQSNWVDAEIVIIPYLDPDGRIIGLRPHKRGLSNSYFREDEASVFYEKNNSNLSLVYGEHFLINRPERHAHRCVICEGEFKADAVAYCGIPALGFQGIMFLRNNHTTGQAVTYVVDMLRRHKIREVVVAFDNEDKANKPVKRPRDKYIAEIHARNTALILENHGFKAFVGRIPDSWMEGAGTHPDGWHTKGKADWDGRLAWHLRRAKGDFKRARTTATEEFEKFLANRQGKTATVVPVPRQMDWLGSAMEDIIWQELNRLQFEPVCFTGGKHEIELAAEITGYCHRDYRDLLQVEVLAQSLRKSFGGYYIIKQPNKDIAPRVIEAKKDILWMLDHGTTKPDKEGRTTDLGEDDIRAMRAALIAANTILYKNPKPFSNFSIVSYYKVLVTEADGSHRKDRLCVFVDSNGRKSKAMQIQWDKMSSAQEARKVFLKIDGLHFSGGQTEIDAMVPTIDVDNYQKTIMEIDTYGYDRDSGLILMGDCALAEGHKEPFLFPDSNGIIWHKGMGYKNSESLATFCHKPPMLFPGDGKPEEIYKAIDWEQERTEVMAVWLEALDIAKKTFGDYNGYIMVSGLIQYIAHPETLDQIPGRPGLWLQGAKGSGKTQTIMAFMRMLGYVQNYGVKGLTGTKVGIERMLSQFDSLPVHLDEWRNVRASDELVGFITNAFNGLSIAKGTAQGTKSIRQSRAATIPVITGEDMTTDTALLSRYICLTMSSAARSGTPEEQRKSFFRMLELSDQFHRIGRYLMRERRKFSDMVLSIAKDFISAPITMKEIRDPRARECTGVCFAALRAANYMITGAAMPDEHAVALWYLNHGKSKADEIEKDIFRLRWFHDCVTLINSNPDKETRKLLQIRRGSVMQDGSVNLLKGNQGDVFLAGDGRLLILVASSEMFAAYQREQSRKHEGVPINIRNIRQELAREPYWIAPPKKGNGTHRLTIDGFHTQSWWVMDFDRAGDLKDIVWPIYERTLFEHDLALDAKGTVVTRQQAEHQDEEIDFG